MTQKKDKTASSNLEDLVPVVREDLDLLKKLTLERAQSGSRGVGALPPTPRDLSLCAFVKADSNASRLAGTVRAAVFSIDQNQPVTDVRTMQTLLKDWVFAGPRFIFVLFCMFSSVGLALAAAGVYGVISNSVSRQTQEIGVRIALGATFSDIVTMVLKRGMALLLGGVVLGLVSSLVAVRLLQNQLPRVAAYDWLSFLAMTALLLAVGLFAFYWPARKASKVDPMVALRYE